MARLLFPLSLAALLAVPVLAAPAALKVDPALTAVIAGPQRSDANKARDAYRHPAQTLTFFGVTPTQTVVEISPSAGWYTEILGPYLRDKGVFYAAGPNPAASERAKEAVAKFEAKLAANPLYDKVRVSVFAKDIYDKLAPAGSADTVLTFRNRKAEELGSRCAGSAGIHVLHGPDAVAPDRCGARLVEWRWFDHDRVHGNRPDLPGHGVTVVRDQA